MQTGAVVGGNRRRGIRATRTRRARWRRCARGQRYAGQANAGGGWQGDGDTGGEIEAYLQRENDGPQQTPWNGGVRRY